MRIDNGIGSRSSLIDVSNLSLKDHDYLSTHHQLVDHILTRSGVSHQLTHSNLSWKDTELQMHVCINYETINHETMLSNIHTSATNLT